MQSNIAFLLFIILFRIDKKLKKVDRIITKKNKTDESEYFSNVTDPGEYIKNYARKILILFTNFKISILNFLSNFEFYIFYIVGYLFR